MATFIEPLALQTWFIQVFSGNPQIFGAVAIVVITGLAAFFRMNGIGLMFMVGLFVFMFSGFIGDAFITIFAIMGGLLAGFWIGRLVTFQ